MFNLNQVMLTAGRRAGEINGHFIATKEEMKSIAPRAYEMLFSSEGTPRSGIVTLHLDRDLHDATLRQFGNGKQISTKLDLQDVELRARPDGKVQGTFATHDPRQQLMLGVPCELESTSPWLEPRGNGEATKAKRPYHRKAKTAAQLRRAKAQTAEATAAS